MVFFQWKIRARGFTLLEILIVISILTIITSIFLLDYRRHNQQIALERGSQLVALLLRDAETRALSIQEADGSFDNSFGVHFVDNSDQYILFVDTGGTPSFYDPGEELAIRQLDTNARISQLCAYRKDNAIPPKPPTCGLTTLSITFERPSPVVRVVGSSGGAPGDLGVGDYEIELHIQGQPSGPRRCVVVWTTGAISIEANAC